MAQKDSQPSERLSSTFGHRIRVRACGLYARGEKLLLAKHVGMGPPELWLPPGGGISFGEPLEEGLDREWKEETGLEMDTARFLFLYEIISPPFHAIEVFFKIEGGTGRLRKGSDPELPKEEQSLAALEFMSMKEIKALPPSHRHDLFRHADSLEELWQMEGHYQFVQ